MWHSSLCVLQKGTLKRKALQLRWEIRLFLHVTLHNIVHLTFSQRCLPGSEPTQHEVFSSVFWFSMPSLTDTVMDAYSAI